MFDCIVIVGLGLIGGSLAAACQKKFPRARIVGVTRNPSALRLAKKKKWIDEGYKNVGAARRVAPTIVILCTPVDTFKTLLKQIDRIAPSGTLVTDAGSVKGFIVRWANRQKWRRIQYVGAHPMAGSHERGIEHARADLFESALTFVTPDRRGGVTPPLTSKGRGNRARTVVINFWKKISGRVAVISPQKHDRITAEISHLPHVLASLLVNVPSHEALSFAASGFLDTTRVAMGEPNLWVPIVQENRMELIRAIGRFEKNLKNLSRILKQKKFRLLHPIFQASQRRRRQIGRRS